MRRFLWLFYLPLISACTTVHTATDSDPSALIAATWWTGLFWVVTAAGTTIAITAWAIAYAISERAKYKDKYTQWLDMKYLVLLGIISIGCNFPSTISQLPSTSVPVACQYMFAENGEVLPDPHCTPGSINPNVTQTNIASTICMSGWTTTIRPPTSFTTPLKLRSMQAYSATGPPSTYEFDHLIPLELGGAPEDVRNLWAEPAPSPNKKDVVENELHKLVCSGKLLLVDAQQRIALNWTMAIP